MKKTIGMIILLILAPILIQANSTISQEEVMESLLEDLQVRYIKGDISANQRINEKFMALDTLEGIGYNIIENLDMIETDRLTQDEENYSQINFYGYDKENNQLTVILSSYFNEEQEEGEIYLYINFLNKEHFFSINGIIENVETIFNNFKVNPEIARNIEGIIDEIPDFDKYQNTIEESIKNIDGNILDTYEDENLISYNIYTPQIDNFMTIGNEKMNLNIAIRCNKSQDISVIYIGTPIIAGGY